MKNSIENIYLKFLAANQSICTDTRKISNGCLFFALRGENFNGNNFAKNALSNGASYAIVDDKNIAPDDKFILVDNVLETLQQLSNFHRRQLTKLKVIALTGSNGKTTTKELINSILSHQFKTFATQGNLNNHIGVPLTLLSLTTAHEFAVVEMGANHQKEIELLCNIAEPDFGLITNIGKAHLEGFGGFEGVKKGKGELYNHLRNKNGKIFIHANDQVLLEMCNGYKNCITYGINEEFDCVGKIIQKISSEEPSHFLKISWHSKNNPFEKEIIQSNLTGNYNFENILAAVCVGNYFGVEKNLIKQGIENYFPSNQRSQVVVKNSNTFILDYYNANPSSMEAALLNFEKNYSGKKIAVIGDMLELGDETDKEHQQIIKLLKKINLDEIILVGKIFSKFSGTLKANFFNTSEEAKQWLLKKDFSQSVILIKGSRGLKMETVMEAFN